MITARELDDRIAAAELDERIAEYRRQQYAADIFERADRLWSRKLAAAEDAARREWTPWVESGGHRCASCHEPIRPGDRWVIDAVSAELARKRPHLGAGPEHARCAVDSWQAA